MCDAHIDQPTGLEPGLYPSDPQGHTLIVGQTTTWGDVRSIVVVDLGGVISLGGVEVRDPAILDQLADRLRANAASLRANIERAGR
jgi:hypothetical protein